MVGGEVPEADRSAAEVIRVLDESFHLVTIDVEREGREVGEAALRSCREQTGQTTRQCIEQARRGEAS